MSNRDVSRRRFLASTAGTVAATALTARIARGAPGANDRVRIGAIGVGSRGTGLMAESNNLGKKRNMEVTAVCDVWQPNLNHAAHLIEKENGTRPQTFTKFREMLEQSDIDAVTIATPDFSHGPILVECLKAGKDVYIEKPMTIQVEYANQALDAAREKNAVVQVGTQHRSRGILHGVAKEVATGQLGKISRVTAGQHFNHARWMRSYDNCKKKDVDWQAFLMHLPDRPFDPSLLRCWQMKQETSNGVAGLWMPHYVDSMALMMGVTYPKSAVSNGGVFVWKDGRENADTFHTILEYPEEFLFDWSMCLGNNADTHFAIRGLNGSIEADNGSFGGGHWTVSSKGGSHNSEIESHKIEPIPMPHHVDNWLNCIRTRERPTADIEYGHQHTVACILAADSLRSGKRLQYDAEDRTIQPA